MGVTYDVLNKKGKVLVSRKAQACFSAFPWDKSPGFVNMAAILYHVQVRVITPSDAELYLAHLKTIGFPITQTPKEILETGFLLDFNNCKFKDTIRAPAIGATLTAVRYVEEFSRIIGRFLNLLDIDPTLDLWLALRLAHVFDVAGTREYDNYFGMGHCLFTYPYNGGHPTKTWPQVIESLEKSTPWVPQFGSWGINMTYGNHDHFLETKTKNCHTKIVTDVKTLKAAIKWLK